MARVSESILGGGVRSRDSGLQLISGRHHPGPNTSPKALRRLQVFEGFFSSLTRKDCAE